jgi:hypothetical protein
MNSIAEIDEIDSENAKTPLKEKIKSTKDVNNFKFIFPQNSTLP